jgi:hypothetical protein
MEGSFHMRRQVRLRPLKDPIGHKAFRAGGAKERDAKPVREPNPKSSLSCLSSTARELKSA